MKNVPDKRDPNKVWYLHVNGKHYDEYENLQQCIVTALVHLQTHGNAVHIETRQQWLDRSDAYEAEIEEYYRKGYDFAMLEKENIKG